jgi:hypothetical protein
LGEFDHFLWVTSNNIGHTVANILLDGIISPRIVDNNTETQVNILRRGNWFKIKPSVTESNRVDIVKSQISLSNGGDYPLFVEGELPMNEQFVVRPIMVSEIIPVGGRVSIPVEIRRLVDAPVDSWPKVMIELSASFQQNSIDLKASTSKRWIIDSQKKCTHVSEKRDTIFCTKPEVVEESWCWNGIEDGGFEFFSTYDKKNIYIHIETKDDTLIINSPDVQSIQDKLIVHFSADTSFANPNFYEFELIAGIDLIINAPKGMSSTGLSGKCVSNGITLEANIQIPKSYIINNSYRLNIGFVDHDDPTSNEPSTIWWKPKWRSWNDYSKSGVFTIN